KVGAKNFGVALVEEAVQLRDSGIVKEDILVFGPFAEEALSALVDYNLIPVVSVVDQLQILAKVKMPLRSHIKLNTGMNRLGFDESDLPIVKKLISENPQWQIVGVCSHLSQAEDYFSKDSYTLFQIHRLNDFIKKLELNVKYVHLFNSAGLIAHSMSAQHAMGARPGIALYGVKPELKNLNQEQVKKWQTLNLKPVMTLKSQVIAYHKLKTGEKVSYGGRWVAPRNSIIGIIPIGYGDGYHRLLSQKGVVLYRGQRAPVVGTVCMDYIMVDLTQILQNSHGEWQEEVILFGEGEGQNLAVEEIADLASTISYELLTGIGKRVPRKYVR
ncbi:MAG: alanine racemase, partial [Bdellovibrionales bacterium]|nr:alanine racemase [Bdellovibrionales bacterium]